MRIRNVVGVLALLVMVGSLIVHLLTFSGVNIAESYEAIWTLFLVVFAIFAYALFTIYLNLGSRPGLMPILKQMPKWTWVVITVFFVYFIYNHVVFGMLGTPVPSEVNGKLIFNNHGHITEYTREEAALARLEQFRAWSGFWAWIALCSMLYLLTATPHSARAVNVPSTT